MSIAVNLARHELETRMYLPSWWAQAYEYVGCKPRGDDVLTQVRQTGLCPAMSDVELNATAVIFASMQAQMFSGAYQKIKIDPREFAKHAPSQFRQRIFTFTRVLQALAGVRFLVPESSGFRPMPLFVEERWISLSDDESYAMEFTPSDIGFDLILGYSLAHLDLIRLADSRCASGNILGGRSPLVVWRAAWQELSLTEQVFLLRLEKAMQWDIEWLHFEGIFAQSLSMLFENLELPVSHKVKSDPTLIDQSTLVRRLSFLERLGRKLAHHGMLRFEVEPEYLAIACSTSLEPKLCWQASPQKIRTLDSEFYRHQSTRFLLRHRLFPDLAKLVACLSMNDDRETRVDLYQSLWQRLISDDTPDSYMVVGSGTESHQISSLALFTEWAIRWNKKHKFTIANVLRTAEFDEVFKELSVDNAADRYMKFLGVIRSIPDFSTLLTKHKNVSVAIFAKEFIAQSHKLKKDISVNSTSLSTNMAPANEKSVKVEPKDSKSQEQQSGLRKLAGEELTKLYEKAPEKYQSLKRSYVDSLDQSKKQILLELESRSKPQQFDHQIRPSLIRFMVENPAVWSGIKPSRLAPTR